MVTYAPVPAPPAERALINLLAAARTPQGETVSDNPGVAVRWQEGIAYESLACGAVLLRDPCDAATAVTFVRGDYDSATGLEADEDRSVQAASVYAEAAYTCSSLGWRDTYEERALASIDAELPRAVEYELWTGAVAVAEAYPTNRWLTHTGVTGGHQVTDLSPGAAVTATQALGILEQALGQAYSGTGIIHTSRLGLNVLNGGNVLHRNGRIIETLAGNRVVAGVGYPGLGPGNAAPASNETWIYVTPMVTVHLGAVELPPVEALDQAFVQRGVNRIEIRPRVLFTVDWDGCAAAYALRLKTN